MGVIIEDDRDSELRYASRPRRVRGVYAERHHRLAAILHQDAADYLTPIQSNAGLHVAAVFNGGLANGPDADVGVVKQALRLGVAATALSVFSVESVPRPGLVLGYGAIDTERIEEGMRRLLSCLD